MADKHSKIEITDSGFRIHVGKNVPVKIKKAHVMHLSGAGIHRDKRDKRKRGNQAKRAWLNED
jgi:hypothetical protein